MANEVRASHILVKTEEELAKLVERLSNGEDFAELAKTCSLCPSGNAGGDLGYFEKGEMVKEFEDVCFETEVDNVATVQTQFGWHLIKVTAKR